MLFIHYDLQLLMFAHFSYVSQIAQNTDKGRTLVFQTLVEGRVKNLLHLTQTQRFARRSHGQSGVLFLVRSRFRVALFKEHLVLVTESDA
jgi:hypothetical protein